VLNRELDHLSPHASNTCVTDAASACHRGGVVLVEPSTRGRIHVKATLEDLKQHMQGAKYAPCALGDVCEEVQEMRLEQ
jgi:hypothetical protein